MTGQKTVVTGATGFIGQRLVRELLDQGSEVTCLVRSSSKVSQWMSASCNIVRCDLRKAQPSLTRAFEGAQTVYHLAASTHAVHSRDLVEQNKTITRNSLDACRMSKTTPAFVLVSSLAATGPNENKFPLDESAPYRPVSYYGKSKVACEKLARNYASDFPITIVRPAIVLGEGDRNGFAIFRSIHRLGTHFVPGFADRSFSVIHVADLVRILMGAAEFAGRLSAENRLAGIYYGSHDEYFTYSDLGRLAGTALGRERTRVLRVPEQIMWLAAAVNEWKGRFLGRPQFLNFDKVHEALAGSWVCSNKKLKHDLKITFSVSMFLRLKQTAQWYFDNQWLNASKQRSAPQKVQHESAQRRSLESEREPMPKRKKRSLSNDNAFLETKL